MTEDTPICPYFSTVRAAQGKSQDIPSALRRFFFLRVDKTQPVPTTHLWNNAASCGGRGQDCEKYPDFASSMPRFAIWSTRISSQRHKQTKDQIFMGLWFWAFDFLSQIILTDKYPELTRITMPNMKPMVVSGLYINTYTCNIFFVLHILHI